MKYPIGIQSFESIIEGGYVYVDKTALIHRMMCEGKSYFLSRPRRFGKSLLVSTLECFFRGRRELFRGLAIDEMETGWQASPVLHMDLNSCDFTVPGSLEAVLDSYLQTWEKSYGVSVVASEASQFGLRFKRVISAAREAAGRGVVVLIDEYDKPILDVMDGCPPANLSHGLSLEDRNRNTLRGFYSALKSADADLRFVLLTGVSRFAKVSVFSDLNQLKDISMTERYETLCGISQHEVDTVFADSVAHMASCRGETPQLMSRLLKDRYDGYHFSKRMTDVYNPFSLLNALQDCELSDYWFASGTPSGLVRLLARSDANLQEMVDRYYDASQIETYRVSSRNPLPLILQSGYLTLASYNPQIEAFTLKIPNKEVERGFLTLVADNYLDVSEGCTFGLIQKTVMSLSAGRIEDFRIGLTAFLSSIPYHVRRKSDEREKERYFQYTIYLLLRIASTYMVLIEKPSSRGRADCVVETTSFVYIFEFKLDGSANEALRHACGYADPYAADHRSLFKVGVSFSSRSGSIDGWNAIRVR